MTEKTDPINRLTPREQEVMIRIADGKTHHHIGKDLGISFRTVDVLCSNLLRKLECYNAIIRRRS